MVLSIRFLSALMWLSTGFCGGVVVTNDGVQIPEVASSRKQAIDNFFAENDDEAFARKLASASGGPTASPAPSPSPSSSPTIKPTNSRRPTMIPSHEPTESHKPSPSPSTAPSLSPTQAPSPFPSSMPSASPSQMPSHYPSETPSRSPSSSPSSFPSGYPTVSSAPSQSPSLSSQPSQHPSSTPSSAPSGVPSKAPTRSPTRTPTNPPTAAPSISPSSLPSQLPSVFPTDLPTVTASLAPSGPLTIRMTTTLAIVLTPLSSLLEGRTIRTFELQTMQFIQTTLPNLGNATVVEILAVTITNQTMMARRRELQADQMNRQLGFASLRIQFVVIGEFVSGSPPSGFNFAQYIESGFLQHYNDYIYRLSSVDPIFSPLQGASEQASVESQQAGSRTVSASSLGIIVGGSIVAMTMAFAASIYAIQRRRPKGMQPMLEQGNDTFVEEVQPSGSITPNAEYCHYKSEQESSRDSQESPLSQSSGGYYEENRSYGEGSLSLGPASPNTMESGTRTIRSGTTIETGRSVTTEEILHMDLAVEFSYEKHREEISEHIGDVYEIYETESEEHSEEDTVRYSARPPRGMSGRLLDTDSDEDIKLRDENVSRPPATMQKDVSQENYYVESRRSDGYIKDEVGAEIYDSDIHYTRSIDPPVSDDGAPLLYNAVDPFARKASDPFDHSRVNMISLIDDNTTIGDTTVGESIASGMESTGSEGAYSIGLKLTDEILASFNGVQENDTTKKLIPRMSHSRFPELYAHNEDPYEELLEDSTPTSSAFSAIEQSDVLTDASIMGTLGARPISKAELAHYHEKNSYKGPQVKRSGLYDVFAPPGPIGMVVDTTRDGPVVHTLKSTSPLIGLIYPGDLIVGLDDLDTRSMTAATLTRLMAKRSHQTERKITLLAVDN